MINQRVNGNKKRERVAQRDQISYDDKIKILSKTGGFCAHCGRRIEVGGQFTVDHVIPLDQGGTNDMKNLVPLCKDCNFDKSDRMVRARWYEYLTPKYLEEVRNHIEEYHTVHSLIGHNYFDAYDIIPFTYLDMKGQTSRIRRGTGECRKAYYSDLDDIYKFYITYFRDVLIKRSNAEVKDFLSLCFRYGAIYFMRDDSNRISCVLPLIPARFGSSTMYTDILALYPATRRAIRDYKLYSMLGGMITAVEDNICKSIGSVLYGTILRVAYYDKNLVEFIQDNFRGGGVYKNISCPEYMDFTVSAKMDEALSGSKPVSEDDIVESREKMCGLFNRGYTLEPVTIEDLESGVVKFMLGCKMVLRYDREAETLSLETIPKSTQYRITFVTHERLQTILDAYTLSEVIDLILSPCDLNMLDLYFNVMHNR